MFRLGLVLIAAVVATVAGWRLLDRELEAANQELELRNRELKQAGTHKDEFFTNMSHELRTPLHTILGYTELLSEAVAGEINEQQARFTEHIRRDAQHLLELINDILDLRKIEAGRLELRYETLDLSRCISEVIRQLSNNAAAKSVMLEDRSVLSVEVRADPLRVKEVLCNLLWNAIKFTPAGGRVWVESRLGNGFVQISVTDTGIGIAPENQRNIFEKFYQAGDNAAHSNGTGLGLAIAKQLVELHSGRIWVESDRGYGSSFHFTLPMAAAATAS